MSITISMGQKPIDILDYNIDRLKNIFGKNKHISANLEQEFWIAISFFPELINTNIEVRFGKIKTSMVARPKLISFFKKKRYYEIIINQDTTLSISPLKASFSARVGCIAHELGHICHYEGLRKRIILKEGILYLISKHFKRKFETDNDIYVIQKGIGYSVYEYSKFIFYEANISEQYLKFKRKYYFTPEEILHLVLYQ